jgi:hypothetical protein
VRSEEVLASSAPRRRPVRRALLIAGLLAAVTWAVVARWGSPGQQDGQPAAGGLPPSVAPLPTEDAGASPYRTTPLDGHWVSRRLSARSAAAIPGTQPGQRLILQVRGTALAVWVGEMGPPSRSLLGYEAIALLGHRVQVTPVGASDQKAIYHWCLRGDRLRFKMIRHTEGASAGARLVTVPFVRWS